MNLHLFFIISNRDDTLRDTLCWSLKCHHNKATIDSPCWCCYTSLLASLHDTFYTRTAVLNISRTISTFIITEIACYIC